MIQLLFALVTQAPAIHLPTAGSTPIDDRALATMGGASHRYGGLLVSDDGKAVFAIGGFSVLRLRVRTHSPDHLGFYLRKSESEPVLYTSSQQYKAEQAGASKTDWETVVPRAIIRAENEDSLTVAYFSEDQKRSAVGTIRWEPKEEYTNHYTAKPDQIVIDGWPDMGSSDIMMYLQYTASDKPSPGYTLMSGKPAPKAREGRNLLSFSIAANKLVCYHFAESGFAHGISAEPFVSEEKAKQIGPPSGTRFVSVAWIHPGKLVTFGDVEGEDKEADRRESAGIYLWDDSALKWTKFLAGARRVVGKWEAFVGEGLVYAEELDRDAERLGRFAGLANVEQRRL